MVITRISRARPGRRTAGSLALALLLAAPVAVLAQGKPQPRAQELDAIVAVVNDDVVVRSELRREIELVLPQLQKQGTTPPPPDQLEKQALDRLILKRLQQQKARELGIEVNDATLNEALTNIAGRNGLTLEELQATLEAGGMKFADFREDTRNQIIASRLQSQEVAGKIQVTDPEIDRFLEREASRLIEREQVRLQHILVALPEEATPEQTQAAEAKARRLVAQLRAGADFGAVAARESDGRNALEGGDLGWFEMGAVPTLVAELAFTMAEGEISQPLQSPGGFHIIKLREIKAAQAAEVIQTHARHILIRTNELLSDQEARQRLTQLRQRILGGDDFATLARANSDDTGSALRGGDLGWVGPGDTVPPFEAAMDALAPNGVSEPFQSPFGWHLVQVLERRPQETPGGALRLKAREALQRRKADEAMDLWLRQLRDESYVEIRLDGES